MKIARQFTGGVKKYPLPLLPSPTNMWGRGWGWGNMFLPQC